MVELRDRTYDADQVVVATGPFQTPRVPAIAEQLDASVVQMHSTDYRWPADVPDGPVLVVGGGNTGYQIAEELAASHEVHLAVGSRQTPLPQRLLGRDLFRYLEAGALHARDRRLAAGSAAAGPRDADRLQPARRRAGTASSCAAARWRRPGAEIRFADGSALSRRRR